MQPTTLPAPVWVARPADLRAMVADLTKYDQLAVDTESNSLYAYREQVCLIQFSTPDRDYLVDPLALTDLTPLAPIFANPACEKIFHAAEYDLICLKRDFGFEVCNIFDTMVAARILGRSEVGLGAILENEFGIHLNKRYQRANWGQRPLPADLLAYARLDTRYLLPLRNTLAAELQQTGRWELAQEDFRRACHVTLPNGNQENHLCLRISGAHDLDPRQLAILNELCAYREERAAAANVPPFKILDNRRLILLAQTAPRTRQELAQTHALTERQLERHANGILTAIQRGLASPPYKKPPRQPRPDQRFLDRLNNLREWRKHTGAKMGLDSDVILPKDILETIAQADPRTHTDLAALMAKTPWRLEHFGNQILSVLQSDPGKPPQKTTPLHRGRR